MDLVTILFWLFSAVLVISALCVVFLPNMVRSALSLVLFFGMASGIYLLLDAEFIAIVQILIYAGAVTILLLFALMLTRTNDQHMMRNPSNSLWWAALPLSIVLGGVLIYSFVTQGTVSSSLVDMQSHASVNNVARIGELLYSPVTYSYLFPFELASLVLLVAIIGAIVIGRNE